MMIKKLLTLLFIFMPLCVFASTEYGHFTTSDGKTVRLTSIGNDITFTYGNNGRIETCKYDDITYNFSYNPLHIIGSDGGSFYSQIEVSNVKFNSDGYITEYDLNQDWNDDGDIEHYIMKCSCTYNSEGYLEKLVSDGTYTSAEEGSQQLTSTYVFSWESGRLMKITSTSVAEDDNTKETYTFNYVNGKDNITNQWTNNVLWSMSDISESFGEGITESLFYIGYFGKGSNMHPSSVLDEDLADAYKDTSNYSVRLNADGTINHIDINNSHHFDYTYDDVETRISNISKETGRESVPCYSIAGQRISKNYKGLMVKKGKKVIVK